MIQLVSCVKVVVTQRVFINGVKVDVNLNESYWNALKVNISDYTERLNDSPGKV